MLKLPLNIHHIDNPSCNINKNSDMGIILKDASVIVWDESTMANKKAFEALNNTMQDIKNNKKLMGGIVLLLAGDFRQTLPIVMRATHADEVNASLKSSYLWKYIHKLSLTINMRIQLQQLNYSQQFANQLLQIGEGKIKPNNNDNEITFPKNFGKMVASEQELIECIFPDVSKNYNNIDWLAERAILAPKNEKVNRINEIIQSKIPGKTFTYLSIDTVTEEEQAVNYTTEFLNTLEPSGMATHKLTLKIGSIIILLRNLYPPMMCNGTRMIVTNLTNNLIEAKIISGKYKNEIFFIPRIPMVTTDLSIDFKRLQFPVKLAFAITINKAQGQSLQYAGIHLEENCFSHGQLYVACSRVGDPEKLYIYAPNNKTKNIVYPIIFND